MNIFFARENKGHFASGMNKLKSLLMTALLLFSQIPIFADTADIENADGTVLTLSSGSVTTGDSGNVGLNNGIVPGNQDHAFYILNSSNINLTLDSANLTTYGYQANGILIEGNSSDSSLFSNNNINMSGGSITSKGVYSRGIQSSYSDNTSITLSGGSITTGDVANIGLTSSVNYGKYSDGIRLYRGNNSTIDMSGSAQITVYGYDTSAVYIEGNTSDSSLYSNNSFNMSGGAIITKGLSTKGIFSYYSDNTSITLSGGSITTGDEANIGLTTSVNYGENSHVIRLYRGNKSSVDISGTADITTYGYGARGLYIEGHTSG
ncbi:MAG: hypothetical protein MK132_14675, partial [Lentisphaerales bacterium]|nr:hypothetical protein [Lentisphaerales bacterium]